MSFSSFSSSSRRPSNTRVVTLNFSSNVRRTRTAGDGDAGVDARGGRRSIGEPNRPVRAQIQGQRHRRAQTFPIPSNHILGTPGSSSFSTSTLAPDPARIAGPSGSQPMPSSPPRPPAVPASSSSTVQPRPDSGYPQMNPETERIMRDYQRRQARTFRGRSRRLRAFFGYGAGNRARKEIVQLIWTLVFGFIQFSVTISFLALSAARSSPQNSSISEWKACNKPLGVWNALWAVKVVYDCTMSYWSWTRDRKLRFMEQQERERDAESGNNNQNTQDNGNGDQPAVPNSILQEMGIPEETPAAVAARERRRRQASLPLTTVYQRLNVLLSFFIVTWFITANIFIYSSLRTCRFSAPHLWWLTFSILSIQYFMIAEVFAVAIIVFIIGPLVFLFWNILLICLGRHPLQNPHYINPEIGKLPKTVVEKIPLVLYIPPPPEEAEEQKAKEEEPTPEENAGNKEAVIVDGAPIEPATYVAEQVEQQEGKEQETHTYPPSSPPPPPTLTSRRSRFSLFVRRASRADSTSKTGEQEQTPPQGAWEDTWERGDDRLPFIRLAGNRAVCAVCLTDFEAPKRRVPRNIIRGWSASFGNLLKSGGESKQDPEKADGQEGEGSGEGKAENEDADAAIQEVPVAAESENPRESLRLVDAGEGPQPLRLLPCGHVFHKTCIDPWLIDVSGRCPTCQRPVVLPETSSKKTRDRN
ncbi:hypothetical protein SCHPADRAFT_884334 [Schizopora paradoxa]|uniref:RING-type domain-containing protein n=1 Tax=Schizopora paradoxa TaxID=27342 RepID=A0A0H2QZ89_9AGAM|nr:hypothetical protein SCHPADRAFT_884334 [Schizopora paradoxa]